MVPSADGVEQSHTSADSGCQMFPDRAWSSLTLELNGRAHNADRAKSEYVFEPQSVSLAVEWLFDAHVAVPVLT
jgi:hypothetical protein